MGFAGPRSWTARTAAALGRPMRAVGRASKRVGSSLDFAGAALRRRGERRTRSEPGSAQQGSNAADARQQGSHGTTGDEPPSHEETADGDASAVGTASAPGEALERLSKADAYLLARQLGVPGRSTMSKAELLEAVRARLPEDGD